MMQTAAVVSFLSSHAHLSYTAAGRALAAHLRMPEDEVNVAGSFVIIGDTVVNIPRKLILQLADANARTKTAYKARS